MSLQLFHGLSFTTFFCQKFFSQKFEERKVFLEDKFNRLCRRDKSYNH
jgi:hypothetical protein